MRSVYFDIHAPHTHTYTQTHMYTHSHIHTHTQRRALSSFTNLLLITPTVFHLWHCWTRALIPTIIFAFLITLCAEANGPSGVTMPIHVHRMAYPEDEHVQRAHELEARRLAVALESNLKPANLVPSSENLLNGGWHEHGAGAAGGRGRGGVGGGDVDARGVQALDTDFDQISKDEEGEAEASANLSFDLYATVDSLTRQSVTEASAPPSVQRHSVRDAAAPPSVLHLSRLARVAQLPTVRRHPPTQRNDSQHPPQQSWDAAHPNAAHRNSAYTNTAHHTAHPTAAHPNAAHPNAAHSRPNGQRQTGPVLTSPMVTGELTSNPVDGAIYSAAQHYFSSLPTSRHFDRHHARHYGI